MFPKKSPGYRCRYNARFSALFFKYKTIAKIFFLRYNKKMIEMAERPVIGEVF
ncbi:hypothetical protein CLOSTMETH_01818 [[Clostridium] methylpentosum DSM 5476]|uniref:Uncharacterized protein n=1 Tax=[Clostridium] methylpentosum DSM 5476 TaxID=537013 RepID=C0ED92_9FIRM|nr:hypothetical protein CLOSTMETH_01818 [[Clostridium] methylpentosum DSM 5476]